MIKVKSARHHDCRIMSPNHPRRGCHPAPNTSFSPAGITAYGSTHRPSRQGQVQLRGHRHPPPLKKDILRRRDRGQKLSKAQGPHPSEAEEVVAKATPSQGAGLLWRDETVLAPPLHLENLGYTILQEDHSHLICTLQLLRMPNA